MNLNDVRSLLFVFILLAAHLIFTVVAQADSYEFNINLDVDKGKLDGQMSLRYRHLGKEPLEEIRLRLDMNLSSADAMKVLSVQNADGGDLQWRYVSFKFAKQESDKAQMSIALPKPLKRGGEAEIRINFQLTHEGTFGKEMTCLQDDPYWSFDAWYPKAMTEKEGQWSVNDDRPSTYDVTIDLPIDMTIASTGEVVEEKASAQGRKAVRLRARNVRGFTIYGSYWRKHRQKTEGVNLSVDLPDEAKHWAKPMLEAAVDAIAFYNKEYGRFPARHLDIICPGKLDDPAHGSSATCNGICIWFGGQLKEQYRWLIAHEVAHQYFGSMIGVRRREINWVPIGLGMMMDQHYLADRGLNDKSIRKTMDWFYFEAERRGYDTTLSQPVEKLMMSEGIWSYGWNMSLAHSKAFFVCSMLKDFLGAEKFQGVIRKIIAERGGTLISDSDLIGYCERALGKPLDWFVADWIDGRATLDYAVSGVKRIDGGWEVEIAKIGTGGFPVIVEAEAETGEKLRQRADRKKKTNRLQFVTNDGLKSVVIDPDNIYPDLDGSNNRWQKSPD